MIQGPHPEEIKTLFSSVAHGYDKANDAMTFGMAHRWRKKLVEWSSAEAGQRVLDCATGTGDLAIEFKYAVGPQGEVIGTDFCSKMLEMAPAKALAKGLDISFQLADAMSLPFTDNRFDISSMAYGIRNISQPEKAIAEMARVVKPGGRVMILETGDAPESSLKRAYEFYFKHVVPRVGGWITGQRQAYEYLVRSSRRFPSRERFVETMQSTGAFSSCEFKVLFGGASFLYRGIKKSRA
jgi:demethylmenaquinone methyltransferase/2-methoxy-6-polyprenyl-1,4-benzoquinol methylase